jgi:ATP-binding cassette subfamily C protein
MWDVLKKALAFMSKSERASFFVFICARALVALLDLIGILSIGLIATSIAILLTQDQTNSGSTSIGPITIPTLNLEWVPIITGLVLVLFATKAIFSVILTRQLAFFLAKVEARAAWVITQNAFGKGLEGARLNSREEILFAVQNGSPSAFNNILNSVGTLAAEGFLFTLVLVTFSLVNPVVSLGAVIYFGVVGIFIQLFIGRKMQTTADQLAKSVVEANTGISDLGEVLREATVLGRRKFFYDQVLKSRLGASGNAANQFALMYMPRYIVETALIVAVTIFVMLQVFNGEIQSSAATIGIFLSGGLRLTSSLLPLQSALLIIKQAIPPANRALDLLTSNEQSVTTHETTTNQKPVTSALSVTIKNLSFSYQGSKTNSLSEINLEIPSGSQAAFVGLSGSGKSTLADLILGLLPPSKGTIELGGLNPTDIIEGNPGVLAYVPQKPGMVSGTIAQNIAMGIPKEEINHKKLLRAIADSQLKDFIASLPKGLETDIGKRKDEFSGGQLQRIGLARALYSEPKLLIMDEATSALDAESESEINSAIDQMRGEVTVVLIAHRLNTIQRSDTVFLFENGSVTDSGTFPELLEKNSQIRNLTRLMAVQVDNPNAKMD